jgi:hypothetical protein
MKSFLLALSTPKRYNHSMSRRERRIEPAGGRPVQVSAGAPGSRPQPESVNPQAIAGRQEPLPWDRTYSLPMVPGANMRQVRREQERGPQHQVNPAASTNLQWGSRAAHITAKAKSAARVTGSASATGSSGVLGAARVQGTMRDAGDPTVQPLSRQGHAYKPKVKAGGAQRESEGAEVPKMGAQENATVGKGPCFSQASGGGKREGMAQIAGSKYPDGINLSTKCDDSNASYMWQPSKNLDDVSMRCTTESTGVTFYGKRGDGSDATEAQPAWMT